jgi:DNA ligase-1
MTASWVIKLNESDSRIHKETVFAQALASAKLGSVNAIQFLKFTQYCYNPFVTFGVRQVPNTEGVENAENPWEEFKVLLLNLSERNLTGHAARDAIEELSYRFDSHEWNNFCAPVLKRDLRAGISEKTINKICKYTEYAIPVFGCQLATDSTGRPEMKGTKRLEPKLDGVRVLMFVRPYNQHRPKSSAVVSYSRNGKVFENFAHIENQISAMYAELVSIEKSWLNNGFILDGEVVGNSFQELMRQARRKENVQAEDSVFHIFDIIPMQDFYRGHFNAPLKKRIALLENLSPILENMPNVELLPHIEVDLDTDNGQKTLDKYAKDTVAKGYEGIMIKSLGAPYECKRNKFWLKYKPVHDYDLTVIGMEEGTGKNLGRMGALVCEGIDDGKHITVNVGSGYTDEERQSYWEHKNSIIGRTAVVLADAVTRNQNGTYSLRFPRFKAFRDDK